MLRFLWSSICVRGDGFALLRVAGQILARFLQLVLFVLSAFIGGTKHVADRAQAVDDTKQPALDAPGQNSGHRRIVVQDVLHPVA